MRRKHIDLDLTIVPIPGKPERYALKILYSQGGVVFTADKGGSGWALPEVQEYAFSIRGSITRHREEVV
jgi:hypothetical protein